MNQKLSEYRNSKGKSHSLSTKSKYQTTSLHMIEKVSHAMIDGGEIAIVSANKCYECYKLCKPRAYHK